MCSSDLVSASRLQPLPRRDHPDATGPSRAEALCPEAAGELQVARHVQLGGRSSTFMKIPARQGPRLQVSLVSAPPALEAP